MLYQPDGQGMLHPGLSAFIRVHPVKMHFLASITQANDSINANP